MSSIRVLGVDACGAGWVGIVLSEHGIQAYVDPQIDTLVAKAAAAGPLAVIAIDIPIGLPDAGPRLADLQAREAAGARRASVFITPVRKALEVTEYAEALALNRRLAGHGISVQAFNLRDRILQVDRWRASAPCRVAEVHPELSFAELAGAPLRVSKSTWAGAVARWQLLAGAGIHVTGDLGLTEHKVGVDDVLDAAVAAWTASRIADGRAQRLPLEPQRFSDGIDCAIWT